tara:strand:- start:41 stop:502 length:462 start_codon:yes stop_codon:yes gene_type:complete
MEMANRNRAFQMAPGSDMPNTGMTGIPGYTLPQSDELYSARVQGANRAAANAMSNQKDPRLKSASTGYAPGAMTVDFLDKKIDLGASGYGQTGVAPGGTIVPLDEILTPEEIARRDAEAKMAQIKSGNFTFADLMRMASSGQLAQSNRQRLNQ